MRVRGSSGDVAADVVVHFVAAVDDGTSLARRGFCGPLYPGARLAGARVARTSVAGSCVCVAQFCSLDHSRRVVLYTQVLIGVVLALVRRNRTQLLQADGLPEFCDIFRDAQRRCYDCSTLLRAARSELALVRKRRALGGVTKLRDDLQVQVADSLESRRYEVVMQKLCPPESTIRQNLFFEIRVRFHLGASVLLQRPSPERGGGARLD